MDHASGAITFKAVGDEAVRATELVAFTKDTKGMEKYPQMLDVELGCSRVAVTAAKRPAK